ncbi:MAG TPA: 2'-5' RNA ligase family protein [Bacteroidia bacterium]|jgi:2'-5' RNA ligase|nr:2'-5' RNA ligase family protein [Bacteroidia bacterium]
MSLIKYFIALIPPEPVFSETEKIKLEVSQKYDNKSALRSPSHITLHMPFEMKIEKEESLIQKLSEFKFSPSFDIRLKNFGCFEPKVIFIDVVKNETLSSLQKELVFHIKSNLNIFNQYEDKRGFHPHLTIAFRDLKKENFYLAFKEYQSKIFEANFSVRSFFLLKHDDKRWNPFKEFAF